MEVEMVEMILEILTLVILVIVIVLTLTTSWISVPSGKYMFLNVRFPFLPKPKGRRLAIGWEQGFHARTYKAGTIFIPFVRLFAEPVFKDNRKISKGKYAKIIA